MDTDFKNNKGFNQCGFILSVDTPGSTTMVISPAKSCFIQKRL